MTGRLRCPWWAPARATRPHEAELRPEVQAPWCAELVGLTGVWVSSSQSRGEAPGLPAGASESPAGQLPQTGRHGGIRASSSPCLPSLCLWALPGGHLGHQPLFSPGVSIQPRPGGGGAGDGAPFCPGPFLPSALLTPADLCVSPSFPEGTFLWWRPVVC